MNKNKVAVNMLCAAVPFGAVMIAGIAISNRVWIQAAGIGLSVGLILSALIIRRIK